MAISRLQPLRPAVNAILNVIDSVTDTLIPALRNDLTSETGNRITADNNLQLNINAEQSARILADNAEQSARIAADVALGLRIDAEQQARTIADTNLQGQLGQGFVDYATTGTTVTSVTNKLSSDVNTINQEIGSGFDANNTIADNISRIDSTIGNEFDASNTVTDGFNVLSEIIDRENWPETDPATTVYSWLTNIDTEIGALANRFRFGKTVPMTIAASGSQTGSVSFNTPYDQTADVCVFLCCVDGSETFTNLECKLISATYSGFSYSITSRDTTDTHTIALGFVSVQVN